MSYEYDTSKKVYTDVPILDELVHNVKLMLDGIVLKDTQEAMDHESAESINFGDKYCAIRENKVHYFAFDYPAKLFSRVNRRIRESKLTTLTPFTEQEILHYAIHNDEVPNEYRPLLIEEASKDFLENYEETNDYYRMLNGLPNYGSPAYHVNASYIPKKYLIYFIEPLIDNLEYLPNKLDKYRYAYYHDFIKAVIDQGRYVETEFGYYISDSNIKYIKNEDGEYEITNATRFFYNESTGEYFSNPNGDYIYDAEANEYILGPDLYIKNPEYINILDKNYMLILAQRYLYRTSIIDITPYQLSLLTKSGVLKRIQEENPDLGYLHHLGTKSIDIYKARRADRYELLYLPKAEELVRGTFANILETTRVIYIKRYYSTAYIFQDPYYEKFLMFLITMQAVTTLLVEAPEWYIRRDVFDVRTAEYMLTSHGIKFFNEIPLKYQVALVRKMTTLIKYKSTTKNIFDLADCFNLKNVIIYKYYLIRAQNREMALDNDIDGGYARDAISYDTARAPDGGAPGDEFLLSYDGGSPERGSEFLTTEDLEQLYSLYFINVPIEDTLDNWLHDYNHRWDYDSITQEDLYWDGENSHKYTKDRLLRKDFTSMITKYLSMEVKYTSEEWQFQATYFLNLIMNNKVNNDLLDLEVPIINTDTKFKLRDLIILLYCFASRYYDVQVTEDNLANLVYWNNRDPHPVVNATELDRYGVYPTDIEDDYDCNGGYAEDGAIKITGYDENNHPIYEFVKGYYEMDGGYAKTPKERMAYVTGGGPVNSILEIDWPETMAIDYNSLIDETDWDGMGPEEYSDPIDLNGGKILLNDSTTYNIDIYLDRYNDVYDGGYPTNSYLYDLNYKDGYEDSDPCMWFHEWNDKFLYPTIDITDRIYGFNLEADLEQLAEDISFRHPRFDWLRGYDIREVLPAETLDMIEIAGFDNFPTDPEIGVIYKDISNNNKLYMWGARSYLEIPTVFKYGIQDFLVPTYIDEETQQWQNIEELMAIYERNKQIYEDLKIAIYESNDWPEYMVRHYVFKYLFTMKWSLDQYKIRVTSSLNQAYTRRAITFQEYTESVNILMYEFYQEIMSEKDAQTRKYNIAENVDKIIDSINTYLGTEALDYVWSFLPSRSWNEILRWLYLLINFFKSYKVYFLEIGATLALDDAGDDGTSTAGEVNDEVAFTKKIYNLSDTIASYDDKDIHARIIIDDKTEELEELFIEPIYDSLVDLNGGTPFTSHYTLDVDGNPHPPMTIYTHNSTEDFVNIDGGPAREADLYTNLDAGYTYGNPQIDKDGGAQNITPNTPITNYDENTLIVDVNYNTTQDPDVLSMQINEVHSNRVYSYENINGKLEKYPAYYQDNSAFIDLDGCTPFDLLADKPLTRFNIDNMITEILVNWRIAFQMILDSKYAPKGTAENAFNRATYYASSKLQWIDWPDVNWTEQLMTITTEEGAKEYVLNAAAEQIREQLEEANRNGELNMSIDTAYEAAFNSFQDQLRFITIRGDE